MARPRKPTALLEAKGAFKKDPQRKRSRGNEPQFAKGCDRPAHIKGLARQTWDFLYDQLDAIGMLQRVDASALEAACVAYAQAVDADKAITRHGLTYTVVDMQGNKIPRKRPEVEISNSAWGRYRSFCTEFGLTPASRSRLGTGNADKPKSIADFLDQPSPAVLTDLSALQ